MLWIVYCGRIDLEEAASVDKRRDFMNEWKALSHRPSQSIATRGTGHLHFSHYLFV
jgi:hypothetical protein